MGWLGRALTIIEEDDVSDRNKSDVKTEKAYKLRRKDFWTSGAPGDALRALADWIEKNEERVDVWSVDGSVYSVSVLYEKRR